MRGFAGNRKPIFFVAVVVVVHFREDPSVLFPHPIRSIDKGRERKRASLSLTGQRNFSKRRGNASMRLLLFISLFLFKNGGKSARASVPGGEKTAHLPRTLGGEACRPVEKVGAAAKLA